MSALRRACQSQLLTRVRAVALRYVRSRLWTYPGGADMVDDVAQEVCVAVFGALNRYRDEGRPFEAFVYGIAARKVADAQRAFASADYSTPEVPDGADEAPTPEEHAVRFSEVQQAMDLMDRLPESAAAHLRPAPPATSRPKISSTCSGEWVLTLALISMRRSRRRASSVRRLESPLQAW